MGAEGEREKEGKEKKREKEREEEGEEEEGGREGIRPRRGEEDVQNGIEASLFEIQNDLQKSQKEKK
jgi:hypothetical protein